MSDLSHHLKKTIFAKKKKLYLPRRKKLVFTDTIENKTKILYMYIETRKSYFTTVNENKVKDRPNT